MRLVLPHPIPVSPQLKTRMRRNAAASSKYTGTAASDCVQRDATMMRHSLAMEGGNETESRYRFIARIRIA
ncbi:MAG: hypothetical protein WB756_22160, partial [Xanthobacteraceae bacterium]